MKNVVSFKSQDGINAEARDWVTRFNRDTPPSSADILALREWVGRSAAHRPALEQAEAFWCDADLLSELAVPLARLEKKSHSGGTERLFSSWSGVSRFGMVTATVVLGIAIALSTQFLPFYGTVGDGVYEAAIGEQKKLSLRDESQIHLDTNSEVRVAYSKGRRKVYLLRGKAHFSVTKDPTRPFEVYAGAGRVRAVGTAFSVYLEGQDVQVIVDEGRVDLARPVTVAAKVRKVEASNTVGESYTGEVFMSLSKGQGASFNEHEQEFSQFADVDLSKQLAWRRGILIFAGDPLSMVVEEVSRYTPTTIEISDPSIRDLRLGGRFKAGELEALFDVLEVGFGVQVNYVDKDHVQLRATQK